MIGPPMRIDTANAEMVIIHTVKRASLDLNLLRVLEALFVEGSVGKASVRLGLSQPATSNALGRLRDALGDPLFVRGREGMVPTPRALELRAAVTGALESLDEALARRAPFEPESEERTFVVAASDHVQLLLLPALWNVFARCPGLGLRIVPLPRDFPLLELQTGALDLAIGFFGSAVGDEVPSGLKRRVVSREHFVVVGRRGHPAWKKKLALELPQLTVAPRGGVEGRFDRRAKLQRNLKLFVPHYAAVPWLLAESDLLAALPERVARLFAERFDLEVRPAPVAHEPVRLQQVWHPSRHADPSHQWLRERVVEVLERRD